MPVQSGCGLQDCNYYRSVRSFHCVNVSCECSSRISCLGFQQIALSSFFFRSGWQGMGQMPGWASLHQLECVSLCWRCRQRVFWRAGQSIVRKTSLNPAGRHYIALLGDVWETESQMCVFWSRRAMPEWCWVGGSWASFQQRRWQRCRKRSESHGSRPPAGSVDQLQGCSLSGPVRRLVEERKRRKGSNTDKWERGGL